MSFPFSAIVTASGAITFTSRDGASHTIARENAQYEEAKELLRQIGSVEEDAQTELINNLVKIASPVTAIASDTGGRVFVKSGKVFFRDIDDASETEVHNVVAERIVWMISEGFDAKPMLAFLDHLMDNPSYRSVNDLYRFMERNQMGITPDGYLLAYKKVRADFTDIHSGKFDNTPGQRPAMRRNEVEDNPNVTCSKGLHVCSFSYLPQFSSRTAGDRVVVCKVNPRDVVSVPVDYNDAKMRVCEYLVLKEIDNKGDRDLLARKPVIDDSLELDDDEDDTDDRTCPNCGAVIGDEKYCRSCGWEENPDDDDEPVSADKMFPATGGDPVATPELNAPEKAPVIEFKHGSGDWHELLGHGCSTRAEAENYVSSLDPKGDALRIREDAPAEPTPAHPALTWPDKKEDQPVDLRNAVSGVSEAAQGLFGTGTGVAVHMRLDGDGGLDVKMRPESDLYRRLRGLLAKHLGLEEDEVKPDSKIMTDLKGDSLDAIEIVMTLEEEFGIEIQDYEAEKFSDSTVKEIADALELED